jgi:hypothetical protein
MSDATTLGKRRTIRFAAELDRLIAARAAEENKPVSEIIRVSVLAGLQTGGMTAGDWINSVADNPARPASPERLAFRKKYQARHQ